MSEKQLKKLEKEIRESVVLIAIERNKIRDILEEFNDIEKSVTDALELFEEGLDTLSAYI